MIRSLILTGASSGIGAALAAAYAGPDVTMLLIGRDETRLADVAERARAAGASVETATMDVTSVEALAALICGFDDRHPVDLVIANAGVALGGLPEPKGQARRVIEINLLGMLNTVEPLLPRMIARRAGQIALVSSISAIRPSGDLPSYSASKAGIRAYGQAIRSGLRRHGIAVTVICPGFVTSPMSKRHHGPKPFEVTAEKAAKIMKKAIARRRGALTFPWPFSVMVFLGNRLPPVLSDWFERRYAARIGD
ncbi:SDR family NAD(P)-dependent oxidoreductase [Pikeienuella sp. HZG-20]|uniref:SDR family NAD(P)-dependent oxidoreductase n=1 Tax=Paludibacillus litoralis TaxID=3133267 RepID=UPI0030EBC3BF